MLLSLSIRDIVLIEAVDLDFDNGLSVLTGETGAGKSILLDALGLVLGARASASLVRQGAAQASVTASFSYGSAIAKLLQNNDIELPEGEALVIRRVVKADGGSRAYVNDQAVSANLLQAMGENLVEIHGQHDDRGLVNPRGHRILLDSYADTQDISIAKQWHIWHNAETALQNMREAIESAARDQDYLAHALAELQAFEPRPGEEALLSTRRTRMMQGAKVQDDIQALQDLLGSSEGGLAKLRMAARTLGRVGEAHPLLQKALVALDNALNEADRAERLISDSQEALAIDPLQLEMDEERLFELRALARKHRVQPDALSAFAESLAERLEAISLGEEGLAAQEQAVLRFKAAYAKTAQQLSAVRTQAATALDAAVAREFAPLKLDAARFRTKVAQLPEAQWGASGMDSVAFEISTNPGAAFGALNKIASGGELSRFILALKVALAEQAQIGTMIFDEIDKGVGGAVASAIGERLARLAHGGQVLVVTHSPQVAACAAQHYFISKAHDGSVTRTSVRLLSNADRREEIARMLSGTHVTDEARAQAERLLN
jgi:DNA repair protein RecN (Recombination protein N)